MKSMGPRGDFRAITSTALIVLIAVLVVSASTVAVLLYTGSTGEQPENRTVRVGDTVKVDYVGRLEDGRVFDTSLWEVASNDALYPKSLSFVLRAESAYTPLQFTVGSGQLITGFDMGVRGMVEGETKVIEVPYQEGYGPMNESKLVIRPLVDQRPVYVGMNLTEFGTMYGYLPELGLLVQDPTYGWDVLVMEVDTDADRVLVMNKPLLGETYALYGEPESTPPSGWYAEVVSIDSSADSGNGLILIRNLLTEADAGMVEGFDLSQAATFYVDQVDEGAGTFRMNYNEELLGRTLFFTVTLMDIVNA